MNPYDVARLRGQRARRGTATTWMIEGKSVTAEEIAQRIHVTTNTAYVRLARLADQPGPITWKKLKQRGKPVPHPTGAKE